MLMICLLIIKARGCCVGGNVAVHAYQLHSWEARRDSAVEPDSSALENLDWERACGFSRHRDRKITFCGGTSEHSDGKAVGSASGFPGAAAGKHTYTHTFSLGIISLRHHRVWLHLRSWMMSCVYSDRLSIVIHATVKHYILAAS